MTHRATALSQQTNHERDSKFSMHMRGWAIRAYGEEMVLMDDMPVPTPGPYDLLIQLRRTSLSIQRSDDSALFHAHKR